MLLASHLLHQVQQVCDRVGVFVAGKLVAHGTMDKLAEQLGSGPVQIEVGAEPPLEPVRQAAAKVRYVTSVVADERDPGMIVVTAERDVRADLARSLVAAGHPPLHIRRRGDELDEIYRRYFTATEATA